MRPIATNSRVKQDEKYRKDMYLAFVSNALELKLSGNSDAFDDLVDQFNLKKATSDGQPPTVQLRLWILALSHVISRLERPHAALVEAVVNTPWTTMDTSFVKSYTIFIGMLLSAKPEYLSIVLSKIAQGFTHQSGLQALDAGVPESSTAPLTRRIVYDRLHYLLRHVLSLIPTLPSTLQPLLVHNFPHKRQNQVSQVTYIRNLLRVTQYCPELADRILATIVDRAIQIDVEIQVELEELDEVEDAPDGDVFELDPFDTVVGQEEDNTDSDNDSDDGNISEISSDAGSANDDVPHGPELSADARHIQEMVGKLDAILTLIFDHFSSFNASVSPRVSPSSTRKNSPLSDSLELDGLAPSLVSVDRGKAVRRAQFYTLLSIFDRTIIRTFKSRYTQFLVFWYSSLDPEFSDLFQGLLVSKALLEPDQPAVTRAAAASYIASFVSRAQFVDREGARRVTGVLCAFLRSHLDAFDAIVFAGVALPNMAHHSVFYAVAQAVFLIFCFRWRDLEEDPCDDEELVEASAGKKWMPELNILKRVVTSALNPLKVCSSNVVMQFARVSQATNFVYCYSIMKDNRRSEYGSSERGPAVKMSLFTDSMHAELNTFFPFDPYRLPRSNSYIEGVYREWSAVAMDVDEEDEDEDEVGDNDGEDDVDVGLEPTPNGFSITRTDSQGDDTGLGQSFGGMSISPAVSFLSMSVS
ncbi:RNA polymerase I-specific transcription initiation factor RRN3 [Athelia psychrophila]|uniref:RNA polymerase I-specific transcription initiation factor RRN3 n=1 Tax=Athelia psychrophila TaxID=1759441 RepID=A0A167V2G9_9AGAM|nr:RNA polymerase I-specific transcription initiation factor RRN3 [Fibularhizoctonia sp. CBS 109695]KZP20137.1 RNA polymerase I-specific transcription initiation factor RRN3 [Fibularhizoctonia sp. CBS 109695]